MPKHTVHNSADEQQIEKAQDAEKDRARDLEWVLSTERGRRFLYEHIYGTCHVSQPSHVPGHPESTAYNEGARAVGENLSEYVRAQHFKLWMKMMSENHGDD